MRPRAPFAVSPEEQALIETTLVFANLAVISSTKEVEDLFQKNAPLVGPVFKTIKPDNRIAFENDQRELRDWLTRIIKSIESRNSVIPEVAARLKTVGTQATFHEGEIRVRYALSGVQACYSYAVALVLDKRRGLTTKLAQCDWSGCMKFRLDFFPRGRPGKYCTPNHKWRAEAEKTNSL